jgi:hypothetical protein
MSSVGWIVKALTFVEDENGSFKEHTWADSAAPHLGPAGNRLWAQYVVLVDLYKQYLDIAWKASVWYYAITGAILTYYLANASDSARWPLPLVLLFLCAVSIGFAFLHIKAASNLSSLRDLLEGIALKLQLPGRPHVEFAMDFVLLNAILMTSIGLASIALFVARL